MSKLKVNCRPAVTAPALRSVSVRPPPRKAVAAVRSLELDWSDPDTILGALGAVAGLSIGILAPIFYTQRVEDDEASLDELRTLNRKTFKETGEYLTQARLRSWPTATRCQSPQGSTGPAARPEGLPCQHRPLEGAVCANNSARANDCESQWQAQMCHFTVPRAHTVSRTLFLCCRLGLRCPP